jgi:hypothetical protein
VEVDPRSGLPSVPQLLAVRADHPALAASTLLPLSSVEVHLRRKERRATLLEVVHDRIDAASGLPLRYTIRLAQTGGRHVPIFDETHARPTRRFLNLMERHAGADAELTLLLLSEVDHVEVEEVVRGQIGPVHLGGLEAPALLTRVLDEVPGTIVLHLALERAGCDVAEDRCRDPFTRLYRDTLSEAARAPVEERRATLGYRVSKERRLVTTPKAEVPLKAALARAGVPLVVRSA